SALLRQALPRRPAGAGRSDLAGSATAPTYLGCVLGEPLPAPASARLRGPEGVRGLSQRRLRGGTAGGRRGFAEPRRKRLTFSCRAAPSRGSTGPEAAASSAPAFEVETSTRTASSSTLARPSCASARPSSSRCCGG